MGIVAGPDAGGGGGGVACPSDRVLGFSGGGAQHAEREWLWHRGEPVLKLKSLPLHAKAIFV